MLKEQLQDDLKAAMLARDTEKVEVLKGLKSAILYAEVAANKREEGLNDQEAIAVFKKESKKRQDSVELFKKGGNIEASEKEAKEKLIIDAYLPEQMSEEQVSSLVDEVIGDLGLDSPQKQDMGRIIGAAKAKAGASVDGAMLAKFVQGRLS